MDRSITICGSEMRHPFVIAQNLPNERAAKHLRPSRNPQGNDSSTVGTQTAGDRGVLEVLFGFCNCWLDARVHHSSPKCRCVESQFPSTSTRISIR
jgi:hypothetical protein